MCENSEAGKQTVCAGFQRRRRVPKRALVSRDTRPTDGAESDARDRTQQQQTFSCFTAVHADLLLIGGGIWLSRCLASQKRDSQASPIGNM